MRFSKLKANRKRVICPPDNTVCIPTRCSNDVRFQGCTVVCWFICLLLDGGGGGGEGVVLREDPKNQLRRRLSEDLLMNVPQRESCNLGQITELDFTL